MATDTLTAGNHGTEAGTDTCLSSSSTAGDCNGLSFCGTPVLDQEGHNWNNFSGGNHQSWWTSNGTLSVTYNITSGGSDEVCQTDIVELQYNLGSGWNNFSGFPKTVVSASGTATKTGIGSGQNLSNVKVRLISKSTSCSPCNGAACNFCGVYCDVSNIKLTASYTTPTGGCCNGSSCSITTDAACGGTYQGDGTDCDPNPCGDPHGRCCDGGDCSTGTEASCGGVYGGDGTHCGGDPCDDPDPSGSCCNGSVCSVTTEAGCGGAWVEDGSCSPDPCAVSPMVHLVG